MPAEAFWAARFLGILGFVGIAMTAGQGRLPVAASPSLILPLLALVFYCLIPAFYVEFVLNGPIDLPPAAEPGKVRVSYEGSERFSSFASASRAEAVILSFVGFALLAAQVFDRLIPPGRSEGGGLRLPVTLPLGLIVIAGLGFQAGKVVLADGAVPGLSSLIDFLPPLVTFGVALLVAGWRERRPGWGVAAVIGLLVSCVLLFPFQAKSWTFLAATCLLVWVLTARGRARWMAVAVLVAAPLLMAGAIQSHRNIDASMVDKLISKIIIRQSETVFCLNFVLREADRPESVWRQGPLYFAAGLVPRLLWPDKPSLSVGADFAGPFCGAGIFVLHSASITLPGEPILRGGSAGIAVAGLVLVGLSGLVLLAWKHGGVASPAALALVPWLIDFDQHFALYIANAVKAGLVVGAAGLALLVLARMRRY